MINPGRLWQRVERFDAHVLDALLAVAFAVGAGAQYLQEEPNNLPRLVPVIGTALPLAWRRRFPLASYLVQIACAILSQRQPVTVSLLAMFVGFYSVAVYSSHRRAPFVVPVIGAVCLAIFVPFSYPAVPAWGLELVGGLAVSLAGNTVRQRQAQANALAERARQLERERELATQLALADERARVARELHDIVAHSVSVMVVQAGAARAVVGREPKRAVDALLAVESTGREALNELRRLLGLLTSETGAEPTLSPQPGLAELDRLVDRVGQAGLLVDLRVSGTPRPLPPGLDVTAYRILQEALTNAVKYASGARTAVVVEFEERELRLEVADSGGASAGPMSNSGRGLIGMRERVAMFGGQLETARQADGGFAVRARLPLPGAGSGSSETPAATSPLQPA